LEEAKKTMTRIRSDIKMIAGKPNAKKNPAAGIKVLFIKEY